MPFALLLLLALLQLLLQLLLELLLELLLLHLLLGCRCAVHRPNVCGQCGDALRCDLFERGHHAAPLHDHLRDRFVAGGALPGRIGEVGELAGRLWAVPDSGATVTRGA